METDIKFFFRLSNLAISGSLAEAAWRTLLFLPAR